MQPADGPQECLEGHTLFHAASLAALAGLAKAAVAVHVVSKGLGAAQSWDMHVLVSVVHQLFC